MKITQLAAMPETSAPMLTGIEVDGDCYAPPPGLRVAGLLWKGAGPTEIDDQLVDAIVGFGLSGVEVVLEIRPDDEVDPTYVLTLAGNAGFSVALLPPAPDESVEAWHRHLAGFVHAFLTVPNFTQALHPISGYFSYLLAERHAGCTGLSPNDPYVIERFVTALPDAISDAGKDRMRAAFHEVAGGEDALRTLMDALMAGLHSEAEKILTDSSQATPNL